jgi:hypothetical protein
MHVGGANVSRPLERRCQAVIADGADGGELHADTRGSVLTACQEEIFVDDVVAVDLDVSRELRKDPDAVAETMDAGGLIDSLLLCDKRVKESKSLAALRGRVPRSGETPFAPAPLPGRCDCLSRGPGVVQLYSQVMPRGWIGRRIR